MGLLKLGLLISFIYLSYAAGNQTSNVTLSAGNQPSNVILPSPTTFIDASAPN